MAELKRDFGRLVIDTTSKVTGKTLTYEDHARLNKEALAQIAVKVGPKVQVSVPC